MIVWNISLDSFDVTSITDKYEPRCDQLSLRQARSLSHLILSTKNENKLLILTAVAMETYLIILFKVFRASSLLPCNFIHMHVITTELNNSFEFILILHLRQRHVLHLYCIQLFQSSCESERF